MKWDIKIVLYLFLAYSLYGVSYLFSDGDFVVPLPVFFVMIPLVSVVFLFTSGFNKYTIFFLLFPMGVLSETVSQYNFMLGSILAILGVLSWFVFALLVLLDKSYRAKVKKHKLLLVPPILFLASFIFILENSLLNTLLFLLLGITTGFILRDDEEKYRLIKPIRRIFVLSSFISWMYIITVLSVYLA